MTIHLLYCQLSVQNACNIMHITSSHDMDIVAIHYYSWCQFSSKRIVLLHGNICFQCAFIQLVTWNIAGITFHKLDIVMAILVQRSAGVLDMSNIFMDSIGNENMMQHVHVVAGMLMFKMYDNYQLNAMAGVIDMYYRSMLNMSTHRILTIITMGL